MHSSPEAAPGRRALTGSNLTSMRRAWPTPTTRRSAPQQVPLSSAVLSVDFGSGFYSCVHTNALTLNAAGYSAGAFYLAAPTAGHLARPCVGMAGSVSPVCPAVAGSMAPTTANCEIAHQLPLPSEPALHAPFSSAYPRPAMFGLIVVVAQEGHTACAQVRSCWEREAPLTALLGRSRSQHLRTARRRLWALLESLQSRRRSNIPAQPTPKDAPSLRPTFF
jgi:hypothetical protein